MLSLQTVVADCSRSDLYFYCHNERSVGVYWVTDSVLAQRKLSITILEHVTIQALLAIVIGLITVCLTLMKSILVLSHISKTPTITNQVDTNGDIIHYIRRGAVMGMIPYGETTYNLANVTIFTTDYGNSCNR